MDDVRILIFFGTLVALALVEFYRPRIPFLSWRQVLLHYGRNGLYLALNVSVLRLLFPLGLVGLAAALMTGPAPLIRLSEVLANAFGAYGAILEFVCLVLIFDFVIWAQHWLFHQVDFLWRFHRLHHSEESMDLSAGFRFHLGEILLSFALKLMLVFALSPTPAALIVWLLVFNVWTLFGHANIMLPQAIERRLAWVFVTPDFHRIHHINLRRYQDSNYGSIFSFWDALARTRSRLSRSQINQAVVGLDEHTEQIAKVE